MCVLYKMWCFFAIAEISDGKREILLIYSPFPVWKQLAEALMALSLSPELLSPPANVCVWQTVTPPPQDENTRRRFILRERGFIHGYQGQRFSHRAAVFLPRRWLFPAANEVCVILSDMMIKAQHNRIIS